MVESIISRLLMIFLTTPWSFNCSWSCPCGTYIGCQGFTQHSATANMDFFLCVCVCVCYKPIWQNAVWFWNVTPLYHITHLTLCVSSLFIPHAQLAQQFNLEDWIGQLLLYSTSSWVIHFSKKNGLPRSWHGQRKLLASSIKFHTRTSQKSLWVIWLSQRLEGKSCPKLSCFTLDL